MAELTHVNKDGEVHIVDISNKGDTDRQAIAEGVIVMKAETFALLKTGAAKKGDVLATARVAGIMAAKKCSELIPLCHPIALSKVQIDFELDEPNATVKVTGLARTFGKTGVEMEALSAVSIVCLTIYDMVKAVDRTMTIGGIRLLEKSGGRSGHFRADET